MTENAERVKREVLELPESERAELVRILIDSLDESSDPDMEALWDEELRRRVERIEEGKARLRPANQVLEEIRDKYK